MRKQYHVCERTPMPPTPRTLGAGPCIGAGISVSLDPHTAYWALPGAEHPTVRELVGHVRLVLDVDPSFPVILGPDGRVMDGMHRIARALLEGRAEIAAVRFPVVPEPDHRDVHPDDLPYGENTGGRGSGRAVTPPARGGTGGCGRSVHQRR